jgi:ubiquinone/menaquinone biosynthesis C-methylase UbiE
MPIRSNFLERLAFLDLNLGPGPLLDVFGAVAFRVALAGVRVGVFDALSAGPQTAAGLARSLNLDERGVAVLLEGLQSLGYVRKQGEGYANTGMARKWLVSGSPTNFAPYFRYWGTVLSEFEANWEGSLQNGAPPVNLYEWIEHEPATSRDFQEAMVAIAHMSAGEVARKLELPAGTGRLLDLGGGHAMYTIAICRRYPQISAVVFDSPRALESGRKSVAAARLEERITFQEGDFLRDDPGSGYDAALLFNVVHGLTPQQNKELLGRVKNVLVPGGLLVIMEQLAGKTPSPTLTTTNRLLSAAYFALLGGQVYTFRTISGWLKASGYSDVRRINLPSAASSSLVVARLAL